MPDLKDGESVSIQGSGRSPYILKNVGGVYSCSCPAWRNQSLPIERRSCKHLRNLRGDDAEAERIVATLPEIPAAKHPRQVPPLLLAETWDGIREHIGWHMSEKLDGVRAWWDGFHFYSRQGNMYHAPAWFTAGLPEMPLDGELWLKRKAFQRTVSIVRRHDESELWREISFVVFDAPAVDCPFEDRQRFLDVVFSSRHPEFARVLPQQHCNGMEHLKVELARVEALGGEGLMLRQPASRYEAGRSLTLLKVKSFHEVDARVIGHQSGQGRHRSRMGALLAELPNGIQVSVGTGFTDAQREHPPALGTVVTVRYQELTDGGVPRFPSFVRVRTDQTAMPV